MTAFRLAQDQGKRVRMIESAELDDGERSIIDLFWSMRRLAGTSADQTVPLRDMIAIMSLPDWQRDELEVLRSLDHAYVKTISEMTPERRKQLSKDRSHLALVKARNEESEE